MSKRNTLEGKKRRRVAKAMRTTPPAYIDLIDYIKMRTNCTTGTAKKVLLSGAIRIEGKYVGYVTREDPLTKEDVKVLQPLIPAQLRYMITLHDPEIA